MLKLLGRKFGVVATMLPVLRISLKFRIYLGNLSRKYSSSFTNKIIGMILAGALMQALL